MKFYISTIPKPRLYDRYIKGIRLSRDVVFLDTKEAVHMPTWVRFAHNEI